MMLQKWVDHEGVEHRVLDDYVRNVKLCDLTAQPAEIRALIEEAIAQEIGKEKNIPQVGFRLIKFCSAYDLVKVTEQIESYAEPFSSRYKLSI